MKNIFLPAIFLFFSCTQTAKKEISRPAADSNLLKTTPPPASDSVISDEGKIAVIRAAVQHINSQVLQVQTFNWSWPSCADVGTISYYLDNNDIVKVIETGFIGDGGWTKEYYYDKGKFIFSFEQNIGGPAGLPADTNEMRIYMDEDTLVLQKKNQTDLPDAQKKLTASSREYRILKALKNKNFGEALCN